MSRARDLANLGNNAGGLETLTVSDITDLSVSASNINSATNQITDSSTDLNVDSNTLVVDKSANSVGIGTDSPTTLSGFTTFHHKNASGNAINLIETDGGVISQNQATDDSSGYVVIGSRSNHDLQISINNATREIIQTNGNKKVYNSVVNRLTSGGDQVGNYYVNNVTVGTSSTNLVADGNGVGGLAIITGKDQSTPHIRFIDILRIDRSTSAVISTNGSVFTGTAATRNYTISVSYINLAMTSGTYTVKVQAIHNTLSP